MRKQEYRAWLEGKMKPASIKDRLSRCNHVETALKVDLDAEYRADQGTRVLDLLKYNINDYRAKKPLPKGISFKEGANVNQRMGDLRSATAQYFAFCEAKPPKK